MVDDLDDLITQLEYEDDRAIATLLRRSPDVIPVLIKRLEDLLAATAGHRERLAAIQKAWDAWYEESDRLYDEHGLGVDIERYRTIPTESLPDPSVEDDYHDPYDLKQRIIKALHKLGDPRAAPVIITALADRACMHVAAQALRDIRVDKAVPALLDTVVLITPDHGAFSYLFGHAPGVRGVLDPGAGAV